MAGFQEFWDKWKWWIIAALTIVAIIVAVIVLYFVVFKKKEGFTHSSTVERYSGLDDKVYTDQFKYAESYINSVLGVETDLTKTTTVVTTPEQPAGETAAAATVVPDMGGVKQETTPAPEQQTKQEAAPETDVKQEAAPAAAPAAEQTDKAKESMRRFYY